MLSYEHNCSACRMNFKVPVEAEQEVEARRCLARAEPHVMQTASCPRCQYTTRSVRVVDRPDPTTQCFEDRVRTKYFWYRNNHQTDPVIAWFLAKTSVGRELSAK